MNATTTKVPRLGANGSRPRQEPAPATRASTGLRAAWLLSALVAVLTLAAGAAGLWIHGLYHDAAWASAAFRGGDLVGLLVAPGLAVALLLAVRGSRRAQLVWVGLLAYSVYNYAFYVFGGTFNDVFLLHVALFSLSVFALALALGNLDVAGIGKRFGARAPARWISAYLLLMAVALGGMWSFYSLRFAVTGRLPDDVLPPSGMHLVYTLDLGLLVPSFALAAVLLWRRTAWGYLLGTAMSVYGLAYQLNFMAAMKFQADAHVAGASAFDPLVALLAVGFLAAAVLLLVDLRSEERKAARDTAGGGPGHRRRRAGAAPGR
jgi:hypothetical protein